jgi:hypothetical protein
MNPDRPQDCDGLDLRPVFREAYPDYGPGWRAAIDLGVDVGQLEHNLSLTPTERLLQLDEMNRTYELLCGKAQAGHPGAPSSTP